MRQFDDSLQHLSKIFYLFMQENNITSLDEATSLLEALKSNVYYEGQMAEQWKEADRRLAKLKAGELPNAKTQ